MQTYHLHIEGQVQGVGFRPFVYQLALSQQLKGKVMNTLDGVHIYINTSEHGSAHFIDKLQKGFPERAVVTKLISEKVSFMPFSDFRIEHSTDVKNGKLLLTPDFALCQDCLQELNNTENRRSNYPFITCTNCGPRFSIINKLPYDRPLTMMHTFEMCPACQKEYGDVYDRRYFSQTNSCKTCGISLSLFDCQTNKELKKKEGLLSDVAAAINDGKIVAVKGIGGFLLFCDASNDKVVQKLRQRKQRPTKPFALMYPSIEAIEQDLLLHSEAEKLLSSEKAPIVLLPNKKEQFHAISKEIAPSLTETGAMLPYSPLFALLMQQVNKPLVATSGNISGSPVIYTNEDAKANLAGIADLILMNNRDIVVPQDDSVVHFAGESTSVVLRRSRGLAPAFFQPENFEVGKDVLALGANMKSTFSLYTNEQTYISQYLGNLDSFDSRKSYEKTLLHFLNLFSINKAQVVIADKHPLYYSTELSKSLAENWQAKLYQVQHHQAHFAAVLAENNLLHEQDKVLGVVMDGTGLGDDAQIWGGEFFEYSNYSFNRFNHLEYLPYLLGDKMAKEPRISAMAFTKAHFQLKKNFSKAEWSYYQKLVRQPVQLSTSSAGRLFDAAASILDIAQKNSFEGEAAMHLEAKSKAYLKKHPQAELLDLSHPENILQTGFMLERMIELKQEGYDIGLLAASFHYSLVKIIEAVTEKGNYTKITFSGGVFQNALLVSMLKKYLSEKYKLYFHKQLSPNDENIAYGQLMTYIIENKLKKKYLTENKQEKICV